GPQAVRRVIDEMRMAVAGVVVEPLRMIERVADDGLARAQVDHRRVEAEKAASPRSGFALLYRAGRRGKRTLVQYLADRDQRYRDGKVRASPRIRTQHMGCVCCRRTRLALFPPRVLAVLLYPASSRHRRDHQSTRPDCRSHEASPGTLLGPGP